MLISLLLKTYLIRFCKALLFRFLKALMIRFFKVLLIYFLKATLILLFEVLIHFSEDLLIRVFKLSAFDPVNGHTYERANTKHMQALEMLPVRRFKTI